MNNNNSYDQGMNNNNNNCINNNIYNNNNAHSSPWSSACYPGISPPVPDYSSASPSGNVSSNLSNSPLGSVSSSSSVSLPSTSNSNELFDNDGFTINQLSNILKMVSIDELAASPQLGLSSPRSSYRGSPSDEQVLGRSLSGSLRELASPPLYRHSNNSSPIMNAGILSSIAALYCNIHSESQRYYCQTCNKPFCVDCGFDQHIGHLTVLLMDAVDVAGNQAGQVLKEARIGIATTRQDIEACNVSAQSLNNRAKQASSEIITMIRNMMAALKKRERELLEKIENTRRAKLVQLRARDEGLRAILSRLNSIEYRITNSMEMTTMVGNPLELFVAKDISIAEMYQIRQFRENLPPHADYVVNFNGSGQRHLLHFILNFASVSITSPGHVGDRRASRRYHNSSYNRYGYGGYSSSIAAICGRPPRGRPIPGSMRPVIAYTCKGKQGHMVPMKPVKVVGDNNEEAEDNLCRPWGVACDKDGNIVIADRSNNRIQVYKKDGSFSKQFGTHGTGPGQFDRPAGIAVDSRRRIIVADKDNHRVQILTMDGEHLLSFGEKGSYYGEFNYPWDVAVNCECQIVVSDTRNHRIQLFSPEGVFLRKYGFEVSPHLWKHFDSPRGVAFNPNGSVVVTDFNNHRLIVIDVDFVTARILDCGRECASNQLQRPQGVIVDDDGNIIVADSKNHRVQIFDQTGAHKWKFGSYGKDSDEMDRPSGVALTPDGRIIVVDFGNNRVLVI